MQNRRDFLKTAAFAAIGSGLSLQGAFAGEKAPVSFAINQLGLGAKMKLRFFPYELKLKHVFTVATYSRTTTPDVQVEIEYDGVIGYGEASMPPYLGQTVDSVMGFLKKVDLEQFDDPFRLEDILAYVDGLTPGDTAAKAAIDIALHDLVGKLLGAPWYRIWGLDKAKAPSTTFTIGIDTPEVVREKTLEVAGQFNILKVKLGRENDKQMIETIRSVSDLPIAVDANQGWKAKEAVELISRLNEYDIELVEQPVPRFDFEGLKYVTANSSVPIMADESCWDSKDALHLVSHRAVDLINIKLMKCGGLYEAKKITAIAEAAGVEVMLGCMAEESGIGITAAASLGAALKNITRADLDATFSLKELPFEGGLTVKDTRHLILSDDPGLGIKGLKKEMLS